MKLNARQVETAKPGEKDYKLPDGNGLILLVKTSGAKYWRYRYTFAGREKMLALGVYPAVSLAAAREKRAAAKCCSWCGSGKGQKPRCSCRSKLYYL